MKMPMRKWLCG